MASTSVKRLSPILAISLNIGFLWLRWRHSGLRPQWQILLSGKTLKYSQWFLSVCNVSSEQFRYMLSVLFTNVQLKYVKAEFEGLISRYLGSAYLVMMSKLCKVHGEWCKWHQYGTNPDNQLHSVWYSGALLHGFSPLLFPSINTPSRLVISGSTRPHCCNPNIGMLKTE